MGEAFPVTPIFFVMIDDVVIRMAETQDARRLLEIYSYYIEETAVSFEYVVPTLEEFSSRIEKISSFYPYLVAEREGEIIGYAYAARFKERKAYDWDVELTIYLDKDYRRGGVGRRLYGALEEILRRQNIINLYAYITMPGSDGDPYSSYDSINFHKRMGFEEVGKAEKCGYKFNRPYGLMWMAKRMDGDETKAPLSIKELLPLESH